MGSRNALGDFCVADPWIEPPNPQTVPQIIDDYVVARPMNTSRLVEKSLIVSGFRQKISGQLLMRTCMAMNNPPPGALVAVVRFGMSDCKIIRAGRAQVEYITWFPEVPQVIPFGGRPVTAEHVIPPFPANPPNPPPKFVGDRAIVAHWWVNWGTEMVASRLCVLRL